MNQAPWLRKPTSCARNAIETLVGNELAMQKNINLSIQMPEILPLFCLFMRMSGLVTPPMKSFFGCPM